MTQVLRSPPVAMVGPFAWDTRATGLVPVSFMLVGYEPVAI